MNLVEYIFRAAREQARWAQTAIICAQAQLTYRELLRQTKRFAGLLRECFCDSDIIGRLGGDEFCVLLSHTEVTGDLLARKRLFQLITRSNENSRRFYALSVSLGIVDVAGPHELAQQISSADALMYQHKRTKQVRSEPCRRCSG